MHSIRGEATPYSSTHLSDPNQIVEYSETGVEKKGCMVICRSYRGQGSSNRSIHSSIHCDIYMPSFWVCTLLASMAGAPNRTSLPGSAPLLRPVQR